MQRRKNALASLKKQVMILKSQLDVIQRQKPRQRTPIKYNGQSSSRFQQSSYDSTFLDKGVKKFQVRQKYFKNISQVINEKSYIEPKPRLSQYRQLENRKTKENFSTQKAALKSSRSTSPNPITGQGYFQKQKGIKTSFNGKNQFNFQTERKTHKKHYSFHLY